uniref:Transketolase n=1 Tax=candidate division WOR-3 bacterium TaxID=2052148 RepID=A0A7C6EAR1_UNCW3
MPILDSKTGAIRKDYTVEELEKAANLMRAYNMIALAAAGSGHSGGTLSAMDITAALYLKVANHDPKNPYWENRDRIIWSTGHKAPCLYLGLGMAGYFPVEDVVKLRKLYSPYQGHPHWLKLPGVEISSGSLGQGLSVGVGIALAAKMDNKDYRVYVMNGDGELQEGQIWEAIMEAGNFKLDNLVSIVDKNRLQIDGWVKDVQDIDPLKEKFEAFKWNVIEIDGHNMKEILSAFDQAKAVKGKPTAIIAHTTKGKGVGFMENIAGWHGKAPSEKECYDALQCLGLAEETEMAEAALFDLGLKGKIDVKRLFKIAQDYQAEVTAKLMKKVPKFSRDYFWNRGNKMKVIMDPTRFGFGRALEERGDDPRVVCIGADISGSITISHFYEKHPERKNRWISVGIAEQSGTNVAAGLAKEGKLPVFGTYGVFAAGRNLDQLRTTVCYGNFNVFIAGAHGGVSVGPDGATHQALEDLFQICGLPNMHCEVPCDSIETKKATEYLLFEVKGPKYLRFAREATPIVTKPETPYVFGKANVIRYRAEQDNFIDAFETVLASEYQNENEDLAIIACGPEVPEAMRAAYILKEDFGIETRVINMHTLKPLDRETIVKAAFDTGIIVTAEEHQIGGLGNWVSNVIATSKELYGRNIIMGMIGVKDRFGESGQPWELMWEFEVSGEHIAQMAKDLYDFAKKRKTVRRDP